MLVMAAVSPLIRREILKVNNKLDLNFHPVTPDKWTAFDTLFGERGACAGCWCMLWRIKRSQWEKQKGEGNRQAMHELIDAGKIPGILAFAGDEAIGWCSLAPRTDFPALERSRILKPVDDMPVWSVTCFFVRRDFRRKGVSVALLEFATDYAARQNAPAVEGYPVEPRKGSMPDVFAWTGTRSAFAKAGFREVLRRSETRPIMRYTIDRMQSQGF
jgi:GNAT superfamily N-acetyltransferase